MLTIVAGAALLLAACGDEKGEYAATSGGFVIEPADEIGPDAFTAPVDTAPEGGCDQAALIAQLESRPDALREWAAVLGVPVTEVRTYVEKLEPRILQVDTQVTNHGLHDGVAYARPSSLEAGTAVLVDPHFVGPPVAVGLPNPEPSLETTTTMPTTTDAPTTSLPTTTGPPSSEGPQEQPVTRCKCGNPLLPPFSPSVPTSTSPTTSVDDEEPDTTDHSTTSRQPSSATSSTSGTTSTTEEEQETPSEPDQPDQEYPPPDGSEPDQPDQDDPQDNDPDSPD